MVEANRDQPDDKAIVFRIGLHLGDVIVKGDDIYGDDVNVAARLEAEAPPGGIVVSRAVRDAVQGRLKANLHALGELALKNIDRPIRAFRVEWDEADWQGAAKFPARHAEPDAPILALPDRPSIAVLPFQNMSGDPEQEYFADGIVEEIITALSRTKSLFVIARNSSFTYKGRRVDVRQVGRELGVSYVLEGAIRKAGSRVRITGQLVDASSGSHIWADRFEGDLENIFELQDHVAAQVVGAIAPELERAETERSYRKPTENLQAYDYYLRGMSCIYRFSKEANEEGLGFFHEAISHDSKFALPLAGAARCHVQRRTFGWSADLAQDVVEAERLARRALELDRSDPRVLANAGWALAFAAGHLGEGASLIDQAIALDPNFAMGWILAGTARLSLGETTKAIEAFKRALRLNPLDQRTVLALNGMAAASILAGRYDEASSWAAKALRQHPNHLPSLKSYMASCALAGRLDEARQTWTVYRQLDPTARISDLIDQIPNVSPELITGGPLAEGLRLAGMPE
jgi:adenylate cyclase